MKVMKWICRYAFLGLLLAGCLFWSIYCQVTLSQLNETVYSLEYVDLAVSLSPEALELLDRIDQFEKLRCTALIATVVVALCLAALITFQVVSKKLAQKKQTVQSQPVPEEPTAAGVICSQCGQHYDEKPVFCVRCGHKFE